MKCGWCKWRRRYQNDPHIVNRTGSNPYATFHHRGRETGPLVDVLGALLNGLVGGLGPGKTNPYKAPASLVKYTKEDGGSRGSKS